MFFLTIRSALKFKSYTLKYMYVVAGDLNTDLGEVDGDRRGAEISTALTEAGLEDMATHFMPRKRRWGRERRTRAMVRGGKVRV